MRRVLLFWALLALQVSAQQQQQQGQRSDGPRRPPLVVPEHLTARSKFPCIDVHSHQRGDMAPEQLEKLVKDMDSLNIRVLVNTIGGFGDQCKRTIENMKSRQPGRFVIFCNLDFSNIDDADWTKRAVSQLRADVQAGAQGLKILRNLGLDLKDSHGQRVRVDDVRFDPIWDEAARLKIPVILQSGDVPFLRIDQNDRRRVGPGGGGNTKQGNRPSPEVSLDVILNEQHRVVEKHPATTFVVAQLGWMGNNLAALGALLDKYANMHVEIGASLPELARQPRTARQWLIRYQNRVLFGKDNWSPDELPSYFRVLETPDESFDFGGRRFPFWDFYGLDLPDLVLKKVYYKNALRVIPGIDPKPFPQ